ncbi:hypothetical protein FM101_11365 [Arthrobacter rhombi]|uniref:Uncharacterized protein n=1 Tax=Arthrobacter rhombi TaxID=71253 RepID=A0A1R4GL70_9MICC|nr:hypothetical protein FM101_11365 [Arthrobacter rhombi]
MHASLPSLRRHDPDQVSRSALGAVLRRQHPLSPSAGSRGSAPA